MSQSLFREKTVALARNMANVSHNRSKRLVHEPTVGQENFNLSKKSIIIEECQYTEQPVGGIPVNS
jgi:hypothetical protein